MKKKQLAFLPIAIVFTVACAFAQTPANFKKVNRFMDRLADEGFSGAVLIAQKGKTSSNGYGLADRERILKLSPTRFSQPVR